MNKTGANCILRWTIGQVDTVSLSDFKSSEQFLDMVWLTKLSIASFQKWFHDATFLLLYNGYDFDDFKKIFTDTKPDLSVDVLIIDQRNPHVSPEKFGNPYHFVPVNGGVWMKWIPWRFDVTKTEIAIDTDVVCINEPLTWYEWINGDEPILIAPERFEEVKVNTCGDFHEHPLLVGKRPFNCGVVGQRAGYDFGAEFFEITQHVKYGETRDSLFITEQGAINLWVRSLEAKGYFHHVLDFAKNAWMRDFIYFLHRKVKVETIHAVSWHKKVLRGLKEIFEKRLVQDEYSDKDFLFDILFKAKQFDYFAKYIIGRQIDSTGLSTEYLISN